MARLLTHFPFSGTFGNLTVYRVGDKCYARTKSSLNKKRFQKDPAFERSRERAAQFGEACRLATKVYRLLPKKVKKHGVFGSLTGMAVRLLQQDQSKEAALLQLQQQWGLLPQIAAHTAQDRKGALSLSRWVVTPKGALQKQAHDSIIAHCSLSIGYYPLPVAHCLLHITHRSSPSPLIHSILPPCSLSLSLMLQICTHEKIGNGTGNRRSIADGYCSESFFRSV